MDETVIATQAQHIADHALLKIDYDSRHPTALLPALTAATTLAVHQVIHNLLHADLNAVDGTTLPVPVTAAGGHLSHHNVMATRYNLRYPAGPAIAIYDSSLYDQSVYA